jgi:hypothetical protein
MPKTTPRQRKTTGRVMHEFKHGELKSGPAGRGGKVRGRRQAVAIALKEAGASKYESTKSNKKNFAKSTRKEAHGDTYQQEKEGKSHVGARGRGKAAAQWAVRAEPGRPPRVVSSAALRHLSRGRGHSAI